jgi:hypothetical protein
MTVLLALHVAISLIAIALGLVMAAGLVAHPPRHRASVAFLWTTIVTSVSGFPLPADRILPSHIVGAISLVLLTLGALAWYRHRLAGKWARIWIATALASLYLNVFVLVVQAFLKVPALHALAPTQAEPPFAVAQGAVLLGFVALTVAAFKRGRTA